MRDPGFPLDDAKEAVEILSNLRWMHEADVAVGGELADDALDDAAHLLWRSGLLDMLITRAAKFFWPRTQVE